MIGSYRLLQELLETLTEGSRRKAVKWTGTSARGKRLFASSTDVDLLGYRVTYLNDSDFYLIQMNRLRKECLQWYDIA
jgi:hypothetical protein